MVVRALLQTVLQDDDGNVLPNTAVQVVAASDGTTPYAGSLFAAESGGSPTTSFQSDSLGLVKVYTPLTSRGQAKLRVAGASALSPVFPFYPAPEDVLVQQQDTLATLAAGLTLSSGNLTLTSGNATLTSGSLTVAAGGTSLTNNSSSVPALSVTQQHASGLIAQFVGAGGETLFLEDIGFSTLNDTFGIGLGTGLSGGTGKLLVGKTYTGSVPNWLTVDSITDFQTGTGDHGGLRVNVYQTASGDNQLRALEVHASATVKPTATKALWGMELSFGSKVTSGSTNPVNVGAYIFPDSTTWTGVGGAVLQDAGVWVDEATDGVKNFYVASAAAGSSYSKYFRVAGQASGGDQKGDVVTVARVRTGAGTPSLPAWTFDTDLDNGVYLSGTDQMGFVTAGSHRFTIHSNGNVLVGIQALATTATNGFLYIPTCAGTPTGVPTSHTGLAPMVYDSSAHKFWFYSGSWRGVAVT